MEWREKSLTQTQLAELVGIPQGAISSLEAGRTLVPGADKLLAIANALEVSSEWLLLGRGPKRPLADMAEEPVDVFATGERRFREWVADKEPQHLPKVSDFLKRLAEERRQRWPAHVLATDVEEGLIAEFRAYRRGEWDRDEPAGVPYVAASRKAR
jgi:transcriptional regulator with XRE-family HTH domain